MQCHATWRLARIIAISVAGAAVVCLALVILLLQLGGLPAHTPFEQTELSAPAEAKLAARPDEDGSSEVDEAAERRAAQSRRRMVDLQMRARDIVDRRVLEAMNKVPRHKFVSRAMRPYAYEDRPLSIGHQQTISQPYIVALMTQLAAPTNKARALDIGTGSGY